MRRIIQLIRCAFARVRLVPRPSGSSGRHRLVPLLAVLPVAIYAYVTQAVVVSRAELRERDLALSAAQSVGQRLNKEQDASLTTCRDYACWSDTCEQMITADPDWISSNLDGGIGSSFGFDIAVLQRADGRVVWQMGMSPRKFGDLQHYRLLERCARRELPVGLMELGGDLYSCTAAPVLREEARGVPRGMLLVGRRVSPDFLAELSPGPGSSVALRRANGAVVTTPDLGSTAPLLHSLESVVPRPGRLHGREVRVSSDGSASLGLLSAADVAGRPAAVLVSVTSRAPLLENLRTIRQMSWFLVILCGIVAIAGTSYLKNRALALRANRDELTGLYNHGYFQERLGDLFEIARRYDRCVSLLMVDIDHFKFVNDSYGHATGDKVLKDLADCMARSFRATDVVARYGGEEFAVVLPETDLEEAALVAERFRQAVQGEVVRAHPADGAKDAVVHITFTVSVGVAALPGDAESPVDLILAADAALGEAKRTRDCTFAYRHIVREKGDGARRLETLDAFFRDSSISTIRPLLSAIDTRKPGSANHLDRTAEYAVAIGRGMGLCTQDLALVCKAALLHDVGEIGIPDVLLTKTGRLSSKELETVKLHCAKGAQILSQSPSLAAAADIVLHHHERYDGSGYPAGLVGAEIPLISRIIAVADSLDAMTSPRPYRRTMSMAQAMSEMKAQVGKQFDPRVVEVAERVIRRTLAERDQAA